jgi:hypothetical protein
MPQDAPASPRQRLAASRIRSGHTTPQTKEINQASQIDKAMAGEVSTADALSRTSSPAL